MQVKSEYIVQDKETVSNLLEVEALTEAMDWVIISLKNNMHTHHIRDMGH